MRLGPDNNLKSYRRSVLTVTDSVDYSNFAALSQSVLLLCHISQQKAGHCVVTPGGTKCTAHEN